MHCRSRAVAVIALIVLAVVFHHQIIWEWWSDDDPAILYHAASTSPLQVLISPPAYQSLSPSSFTPLVTLSFALDLAIAGTSPGFFYAHQLVALSAAMALLFLLLCTLPGHRTVAAAWLAAAGFLVSPLGTYAARTLMIRHYVEGLFFALLSLLIATVKPDSRSLRTFTNLLGAALYGFALMAKEIYAGLPLLILWQDRARGAPTKVSVLRMVPYSVVLLVYMAWRSYMLGSFGGYARQESLMSRVLGGAEGVAQVIVSTIPRDLALGTALCALFLTIAGIVARPRWAAHFLLLATLILFAPLAGAASEPQIRYAFLPMVMIFAGAAIASSINRRPEVLVVFALSCLLLGFAGWSYGKHVATSRESQNAEGRYIWTHTSSAPILWGSAPSWYLGGLARTKAILGRGDSPGYILSPEGVLLSGLETHSIVASSFGKPNVSALDENHKAVLARVRSRFAPEEDLHVSIRVDGQVLTWDITPTGDHLANVELPTFYTSSIAAVGARRVAGSEEFRILRTLADGRWTISPPLRSPQNSGTITYTADEIRAPYILFDSMPATP